MDVEKAQATVDAIEAKGGTARAYGCDVLDEGALTEIASAIEQEWGVPDFLINGAGGNHPRGTTTNEFFDLADVDAPDVTSFFDLDYNGFQFVFSLNFLGTFLPIKVFARARPRLW